MELKQNYDVVIIGGGPAGVACALLLLRQNIVPLIVEKQSYPCIPMGESLSSEVLKFLSELDLLDAFKALDFPAKYGVKLFSPAKTEEPLWVQCRQRTPEGESVLAESCSFDRREFHRFMLDAAISRGAQYIKGAALAPLFDQNRVCGVKIKTNRGEILSISSQILLDASGHATFLSQHKVAGRRIIPMNKAQIAISSMFKDSREIKTEQRSQMPGNTLLFIKDKRYWSWFIPVTHDWVSVGVVMQPEQFKVKNMPVNQLLNTEIRSFHPELSQILPNLDYQSPVQVTTNFTYSIDTFAGPGWICLADAHRFIDPVFSLGISMAFSESKLAVQCITQWMESECTDDSIFFRYQDQINKGQNAHSNAVEFFWEFPQLFKHFAENKFRLEVSDLFAGRFYGKQNLSNSLFVKMHDKLYNNQIKASSANNAYGIGYEKDIQSRD